MQVRLPTPRWPNAGLGPDDALTDLLGGDLGDGVTVACAVAGDEMVATADATLTSPIPGLGSWSFTLEGRARNEEPVP